MDNSRFKFRAWDKKLSRMDNFTNCKSGVEYCDGDFQVSSGYDGYDRPTYEDDTSKRYDLMQFTGLLDKNGVEIYEGDILSDDQFGVSPVVFEEESASFVTNIKCHETGSRDQLARFYCVDGTSRFAVVIGNIYENPELMEAK